MSIPRNALLALALNLASMPLLASAVPPPPGVKPTPTVNLTAVDVVRSGANRAALILRKTGSGATPSFQVRVVARWSNGLSTWRTITVPANGTGTWTANVEFDFFSAPEGVQAYELSVHVDAQQQVPETNESDNHWRQFVQL